MKKVYFFNKYYLRFIMRQKVLFGLLFISLIQLKQSNAQILNVDREIGGDTSRKSLNGSIITTFSSDKLKGSLIDISNKSEIDKHFKNNYILVGQFNNDLTILKKEILQNEGYFHLRFRDNDKRKYSIEGFIQYQWNGTLGMEHRKVIGSNLRIKLYDKENKDLYYGVGIFHENEKWNFTAIDSSLPIFSKTKQLRKIYRLNNYWKFAYKLNELIDLTFLSYIQFPINSSFFNVRWYLESNANFKFSNRLNFVLHWDHTIDKYRVVPISEFYYSASIGIQMSF